MFALPKLLPDPTHLSIQFRVGTEGMKIKIKVQHKISNQNRIYSSRQHLSVYSVLTPAPVPCKCRDSLFCLKPLTITLLLELLTITINLMLSGQAVHSLTVHISYTIFQILYDPINNLDVLNTEILSC